MPGMFIPAMGSFFFAGAGGDFLGADFAAALRGLRRWVVGFMDGFGIMDV